MGYNEEVSSLFSRSYVNHIGFIEVHNFVMINVGIMVRSSLQL